jgi:transcription elongation factor Elf1
MKRRSARKAIPLIDAWVCAACGATLVTITTASTRVGMDAVIDPGVDLPNARCSGCGQTYQLVDSDRRRAEAC